MSQTIKAAQPCATCGSHDLEFTEAWWQRPPATRVHCKHCGAKSAKCKNTDAALRSWNAWVEQMKHLGGPRE